MGGGRRYSLGIQGDLEQSFEDGLELTTQSKTPYDGDQLNGTLILDNYEDDRFMALAPHTGVIDIAVPRKISSNVTIPAPAASTIGNWIRAARTA